jgi:hypothetical protein
LPAQSLDDVDAVPLDALELLSLDDVLLPVDAVSLDDEPPSPLDDVESPELDSLLESLLPLDRFEP